jgi:ribonucleoside-diphosphate reductase alpha chain
MNRYEQISEERKSLQATNDLPDWFVTSGYQLFKDKYLYESSGLKDTYHRISATASQHTDDPELWEAKFFDVLWNGWLACSTTVLANMGTDRGLPVSCSGSYIQDSINGFYAGRHEVAMLTKNGFGTSSYLGDIRPRGSDISVGGKASGVLPVFKGFVQDMRDVAQGTARRGAWAGYLPIDHGDFDELCDHVYANPDDANVGFVYTDSFIDQLKTGCTEAIRRYQKHMKLRAVTGKGYFFFEGKVDRHQPDIYHDLDKRCKASQLCTEVTLHSDDEYTYTCVLSSMNAAKFDEWKDTDAVFVATVFLDCVAQEFIDQAKYKPKLKKAIKFTEESRALGLGILGFHTYLQKNNMAFESFEAHMANTKIFKHLHDESLRASEWMAKNWGEPEWCKGYGVRNTHRTCVAPNTSSAMICGGVSQGIEPIVSNVYVQLTSAGEVTRANPQLIEVMKDRGVYNQSELDDIAINNKGSVQHVDWLNDDEKLVFRTAFEIDQRSIIRLASARQKWICQAQSINLFFDADESEEYISEVHRDAILDENILTLYYMRSEAGVQASKGECLACEG